MMSLLVSVKQLAFKLVLEYHGLIFSIDIMIDLSLLENSRHSRSITGHMDVLRSRCARAGSFYSSLGHNLAEKEGKSF
jgi:hypothetical protein